MRKIISVFSLIFVAFFLMTSSKEIKAEKKAVNLSIKAVFDDQNPEISFPINDFEYGGEITFGFGATHVGFEFAFWVVDGIVDYDRPYETTFVATNNLDAIAVFHPVDQYAVLFVDANGKLLETQFVSNEDGKTVEVENKPDKIGFVFKEWENITDNGSSLKDIKGNTVFRAKYERTKENPIIINEVEYGYNDIVNLELPSGMTHWEEDGKIVAYGNYTFTALYPRTLVAKDEGEPETLVTLNEIDGFRDEHTTYLVQVDLLGNHQLIEFGLEIDGVLRKASNINPLTNEFLISTKEEYNTVRAYAIVKVEVDEGKFEFVTVFDREFIKDALVEFDFKNLEGKGTLLTETTTNNIFDHELLGPVVATLVYDGNGAGSGYANTTQLIKFGSNGGPGKLELEFLENVQIKTIVIYAAGWGASEGTILVNGESISGVDKLNVLMTRYVIELDDVTNEITIETTAANKRALIFEIGFYGPEAEVPEIIEHEVKFDLGYDDEFLEPQYILDGEKANEPIKPFRDDYDFQYWMLNDTEFDFETEITNDIILVAKWEEKQESLTHYLELIDFVNDFPTDLPPFITGTNDRYADKGLKFNNDNSYITIIGLNIVGPAMIKVGLSLNTASGTGTNELLIKDKNGNLLASKIMVTGIVDIYLEYDNEPIEGLTIAISRKDNPSIHSVEILKTEAKEKYDVTFNVNGGTPQPTVQSVEEGAKITEPTGLINGDLVLEGWYKESTFTTKWNFATDVMPSSDLILYAKWIEEQGGEYLIYQMGFEDSTTTNSYAGKVEKDEWTFMFGNIVSTASPAYGSKHVLLRVAKKTSNVAYAEYKVNEEIYKITFQSKVTSSTINGQIQFSIDGINWGTAILFSPTTTYSQDPFDIESNVEGALYVRISTNLPGDVIASNRDLLLDDVKIYGLN